MPYDARIGAKYRDSNGDQIKYCMHNYVCYVKQKESEQSHGELFFRYLEADYLDCTCLYCGDVIYIGANNIVTWEDKEKRIAEIIKEEGENNGKSKSQKKLSRRKRKND